MGNKFILDPSGWDYAKLSNLASENGGPQKLLNAVSDASLLKGGAISLGAVVIGALAFGVMKRFHGREKSKTKS